MAPEAEATVAAPPLRDATAERLAAPFIFASSSIPRYNVSLIAAPPLSPLPPLPPPIPPALPPSVQIANYQDSN